MNIFYLNFTNIDYDKTPFKIRLYSDYDNNNDVVYKIILEPNIFLTKIVLEIFGENNKYLKYKLLVNNNPSASIVSDNINNESVFIKIKAYYTGNKNLYYGTYPISPIYKKKTISISKYNNTNLSKILNKSNIELLQNNKINDILLHSLLTLNNIIKNSNVHMDDLETRMNSFTKPYQKPNNMNCPNQVNLTDIVSDYDYQSSENNSESEINPTSENNSESEINPTSENNSESEINPTSENNLNNYFDINND